MTTISLTPVTEGMHVVVTEQSTILDGRDKVEHRQAGIAEQLGRYLAGERSPDGRYFSSVATTSTCEVQRNWSMGVTEVIR